MSTVVTTLIILVVAVLLASVVTFYAINVTTTRTASESLQISEQHMWNNGTTFSECAFLMVNTGGTDSVVDKITVRGQDVAVTDMFFNKTSATIGNDLPFISPTKSGTALGNLTLTLGSSSYRLTQGASGSKLILKSGESMIIYIVNPDHVSTSDIGVSVGFTVFTASAQWYKECDVEASS